MGIPISGNVAHLAWTRMGGREATALFGATLGFPGESPRLQWPGQQRDLRGQDLRVKVQSAIVKHYGTQFRLFETWVRENQLIDSNDTWTLFGEELCSMLCAYVQHQYISGEAYQQRSALRPAWQTPVVQTDSSIYRYSTTHAVTDDACIGSHCVDHWLAQDCSCACVDVPLPSIIAQCLH
eukprot:5044652-Amphidinium_carterae.1